MLKVNLISFYNRLDEYPTKYSLGTLKLASYLGKNDEIDVKIYPIDSDHVEIKDKVMNLIKNSPDIIGIPNYMWTEKIAQKISEELKKQSPNTLKIIGGPSTNEVDFDKWQSDEIFTLGEGEEILEEICKKKMEDPNFCAKEINQLQGQNVFSKEFDNTNRTIKYKSKEIPMGIPLYSDKMQNMKIENDKEKFAWYETTRGCLYNCGYCGHKTRNNLGNIDIDRIKEELINMEKQDIDRIFIVDPIIGGTKENGKKVLRLFQEQIPDAKLIAYLRPELLDDEYVGILKNSNLEEMRFGIQTLNPNVPNWVRSNSIDKIKMELSKLRNKKINWRAELIVGLPGDNLDGLKNSIKCVMNEFQPTVLSAYHLTAIPGTRLYDLVDNSSNEWLKVDENSQVIKSHSYTENEFKKMSQFAVSITSLYNLLKKLQPNKNVSYDKIIQFVQNTCQKDDLVKFENFDLNYAEDFWKKKICEELNNEKDANNKTWRINRQCKQDNTR